MSINEYLTSIFLYPNGYFEEYSKSAPHRYKIYTIPKKNGKGNRVIAHPSKELKVYQRCLVTYLEELFEASPSAYAYIKNRGVKNNALVHQGTSYMVKMDFKNFFPSISPELLFESLSHYGLDFDELDEKVMSGLLFLKKTRISPLTLSIGAPSSPLVSNIVMFEFDTVMRQKTSELGINYSRYADDITFSSNIKDILFDIPEIVRNTLIETTQGSFFYMFEQRPHCYRLHTKCCTQLV